MYSIGQISLLACY